MDIFSYALGKKAGGGSPTPPRLQEKSLTITEDTTTTVTPDTGYDGLSEVEITTSVGGGVDLSDYFANEITSFSTDAIKMLPDFVQLGDDVTTLSGYFSDYVNLETAPNWDTSNIEEFEEEFYNCENLTNVPQYDGTNATTIQNMFSNCSLLSNESLENILEFLLSCTSYEGDKYLGIIGLNEDQIETCTGFNVWQQLEADGWEAY